MRGVRSVSYPHRSGMAVGGEMKEARDSWLVESPALDINNMFQLVLALIFVAMILTPAIVAARSGKKETESESAPEAQPIRRAAKTQAEPAEEANAAAQPAPAAASTLPLHRTLGLSGR